MTPHELKWFLDSIDFGEVNTNIRYCKNEMIWGIQKDYEVFLWIVFEIFVRFPYQNLLSYCINKVPLRKKDR
jgi:hypothetical protein